MNIKVNNGLWHIGMNTCPPALAAADEKLWINLLGSYIILMPCIYSHRTLLRLLHCALSKAPLVHSNPTTGTDCNINISITDNIRDDVIIIEYRRRWIFPVVINNFNCSSSADRSTLNCEPVTHDLLKYVMQPIISRLHHHGIFLVSRFL